MTGRRFRPALVALSLVLAGCASAELKQTTAMIDTLSARVQAGPLPGGDGALSPDDLLVAARAGGPGFLEVQLSEAQARIDLDRRKSGLRPRVSVGARQRITATGADRGVFDEPDLFVGLDWDITAALLLFDRDSIQIAEELIPIQARLDGNTAANALFTAYFDYAGTTLDWRELAFRRTAAACRAERGEVELALGNINATDLSALKRVVTAVDGQLSVAKRASESARRQVLYLAGLSEELELDPAGDPAALFGAQSASISREQCYLQSGNAVRDSLLLAGATSGIKTARLERLGNFNVFLPSEVSPTAGLNLDLLLSYVLPLIDQGDATRRVQEARLALLNIALAGERNRRRFDLALSSVRSDLAKAAVNAASAREKLARTRPDNAGEQSCDAALRDDLARLDIQRAVLRARQARTRLALLCAPAPPPGRNIQAIRAAAFAALGPANQK